MRAEGAFHETPSQERELNFETQETYGLETTNQNRFT